VQLGEHLNNASLNRVTDPVQESGRAIVLLTLYFDKQSKQIVERLFSDGNMAPPAGFPRLDGRFGEGSYCRRQAALNNMV
jgi:hypothetical protein